MSSSLGVLGFLVLIIASLLLVFWGLHPIWSLIDLVVSVGQPSEAKLAWALLLIFTWSLGALLYGTFGTKSNILRNATISVFLGSIIFLVAVGIIVLGSIVMVG